MAICAKMYYNDQGKMDLTDCESPCNPRSASLQLWAKCPIESEGNKCPIVGIKLLDQSEASTLLKDSSSEWKVQSYTDMTSQKTFYLAYSTTDSDENPLVTAWASDLDPCLDPSVIDHTRL